MKTKFIPFVCAGLAAMLAVTSCGGQKQAASTDFVEVSNVPFDTPEYKTDANYFRATASGTSKDLEMARTIADLNARNALAAQTDMVINMMSTVIQRSVERLRQQYVRSSIRLFRDLS